MIKRDNKPRYYIRDGYNICERAGKGFWYTIDHHRRKNGWLITFTLNNSYIYDPKVNTPINKSVFESYIRADRGNYTHYVIRRKLSNYHRHRPYTSMFSSLKLKQCSIS